MNLNKLHNILNQIIQEAEAQTPNPEKLLDLEKKGWECIHVEENQNEKVENLPILQEEHFLEGGGI